MSEWGNNCAVKDTGKDQDANWENGSVHDVSCNFFVVILNFSIVVNTSINFDLIFLPDASEINDGPEDVDEERSE